VETKIICLLIFGVAAISGCVQQDHAVISDDLWQQAHLAFKQGNLDRAEKLYLQAKYEAQKSDSPMQLPHVLSELGEVYAQKGDAADAQSCFDQSIQLYDAFLAKEKSDEQSTGIAARKVETLVSLANLFREQGQFDRAETTYKRAMDQCDGLPKFIYDGISVEYEKMLRKKGQPQQAYQRARTTLDQTGADARWQKDFQKAVKQYMYYLGRPGEQKEADSVLDYLHETALRLGPADPRLAASYDFLVTRQRVEGHLAQAEKKCLEAIQIADSQPAVPVSTRANLRGQLANIYEHEGKLEKAEALLNQAIALASPNLAQSPPIDKFYAHIVANLYAEDTIVLQKLNKPQEALRSQKAEIDLRLRFQNWRELIQSARMLYDEPRLRVEIFEAGLQQAETVHNRQGMGCIRSMWASVLAQNKQTEKAEQLLTLALEDLKVAKGEFCLARTCLLLATIKKDLHQDKPAEQYFQQGLAVATANKWVSNPELKTLINRYHSN